ncbi:calcium:proton antiporter [Achromobacter aloeverae]|uniref:Calcium:proton antiporter n=1 Tax=Achromobacter aloeverae TaxID=1750518 RepID=A0A4Q1HGK0_9BURK|nr:calcium:proton antiporter [Achromobacter aloeverae]RXN86259.1 calcium:proton antiporter [Achromobacter aloeverae]
MHLLKQEKFVVLALVIAFAAHSAVLEQMVAGGWPAALIVSVVLVATILTVSMSVAHHAEQLAHKVGDPYGSMLLTLSAVVVEVIVLAIVLIKNGSPTLARDSIYAAVMLDINGTLGLAALIGGFKHGEQSYNDDSGRTYTVMILTAMGIAMVVPEFVPPPSWALYDVFTMVALVLLYSVFLRMQVGPHSYFFSYSYPDKRRPPPRADTEAAPESRTAVSIVIMLVGVAVVGMLAESLSVSMPIALEGTHAPLALLALVVAIISAGPEIITALRAALRNRMQSTVNIAMGASLSTVTLTIPIITLLAMCLGLPLQMAMTPAQAVMTVITLVVAAINLNDGQTNAIEGMTHLVLFLTFLMLTAIGL